MTPEQGKQVEEIPTWDAWQHGGLCRKLNGGGKWVLYSDHKALLDDVRKQLNAAILLGEAAASLHKPMTDKEFDVLVKGTE